MTEVEEEPDQAFNSRQAVEVQVGEGGQGGGERGRGISFGGGGGVSIGGEGGFNAGGGFEISIGKGNEGGKG